MNMSSLARWLTFNGVGLAGVVVQLVTLAVLTQVVGWPVLIATAIAVELALLHNFACHLRWTWRDRPSGGGREVAVRLWRFHAVNGVVSLVGNVVITSALARSGMDPILANVAAIAACSLVNFAAGDAFVFRAATVLTLAAVGGAAVAQAQSPAALAGWEGYVATVDRRHAGASAAFFALDARQVKQWRARAAAGEIPMTEVEPPSVEDGKMHHWAGAVHVPHTTVATVIKRLQDYAGRESEFYEEVKASKLLGRDGDRVRVFMRLQRDASVITVNYNTEHAVEYRRIDASRAASRSVATKIAELAEAGTAREHEKAPGDDHGFL